MNAQSVEARRVLQELADVPGVMQKNLEGIASPNSVEALTARHDARVADFIDLTHGEWSAYRKRVADLPSEERLREGDFYTQIATAARRGDQSAIPEVQRAAQFLRSRVFDPLKEDAQNSAFCAIP
jgi:hypothetical protein